jgi:hypothetical protein
VAPAAVCVLQGNYFGALECMERGLVLRKNFFGADAVEVRVRTDAWQCLRNHHQFMNYHLNIVLVISPARVRSSTGVASLLHHRRDVQPAGDELPATRFGCCRQSLHCFATAVDPQNGSHGIVCIVCAEKFPMVLELLKKARVLTERDDRGRAVTFNNFACYYRRQGKLHSALQFLEKALAIEARLPGAETSIADTHLNLCAVLSHLGR